MYTYLHFAIFKYQMNWLASYLNKQWVLRIDPLLDRLLAEHEEEIAEKDNALRLSTTAAHRIPTSCVDLLGFVDAALRFD